MEDTEFEHLPVAIADAEVMLDGHLTEAFWQRSTSSRLMPRDPLLPNDDPTRIRLAWTNEALYVGIEQPADRSSALLGISLMAADRKGVQLSLYATKTNGPQTLNAYFHDYDANGGLRVVRDRAALSQSVGSIIDDNVTTELRFLWSDIGEVVVAEPGQIAKRDFLFNIESYSQPDSKVPNHVSSPWLIGTSPTWNSGYCKSLRLENGIPTR